MHSYRYTSIQHVKTCKHIKQLDTYVYCTVNGPFKYICTLKSKKWRWEITLYHSQTRERKVEMVMK